MRSDGNLSGSWSTTEKQLSYIRLHRHVRHLCHVISLQHNAAVCLTLSKALLNSINLSYRYHKITFSYTFEFSQPCSAFGDVHVEDMSWSLVSATITTITAFKNGRQRTVNSYMTFTSYHVLSVLWAPCILSIGVARIFSAGCTFFLKKLITFFKTAKLTLPPSNPSPSTKNFLKIDFLFCFGVHLQLTPINYANFFLALRCTPWLHPYDITE